ncbi:hypothetical protein EJD97_009790 [Solanum chilense]|uniref:Bifunctional inhibitor/plant lipid transfer protein/seed storage helical domain-containing protein n=1 Tax=Solanum chilense TaxID=4083 RepID=A0A6N2BHT2_SOLCI|nr:hypothetical protein EJD97_009790 [Solanum chilense]
MEGKGLRKQSGIMLMMVIMALIICDPINVVESAVGIDIHPCTLPACIAACKELLKDKYKSATCATGPKGKYCICLG